MILNPLALGLFNLVLLLAGIRQLTWCAGFFFPRVRGNVMSAVYSLGFEQIMVGALMLGFVTCTIGAYSHGTRWRAFGIGLALCNFLALATTAFVFQGPMQAFMGLALDFALVAYLALIMAAKVRNPS